MTPAQKDRIEILREMYPLVFKPGDKWGDILKIDMELLIICNEFAKHVLGRFGKQIRINCGYEDRATGYHPKGMAADMAAPGLSCVDLYLTAERFDGFNGLGIYPDWHTPGIHGDIRPKQKKLDGDARWGCLKRKGKQVYPALDKSFMEYAVRK